MSEMNPYLAAMYNTHGAAEQMTEDMQKTANAELFCKLAADNGLDLSRLNDEQIASVYAQVFPEDVAKYAAKEEDEKGEGKEHEKKETPQHEAGEQEEEKEEAKEDAKEKEVKAAAYFQEKQAFVEKCAESDYMGRIMAHAFTQEKENIEVSKIASIVEYAENQGWTEDQLIEVVKEAAAKELVEKAVGKLRGAAKAVKERAGGLVEQRGRAMEAGHAAGEELKGHKELLKNLPGKAERAAYKATPHREGVSKAEHMAELRKMKMKGTAAKYAPHAAVGAVGVTGGAVGAKKMLGKKDEEKESRASAQAFEELSANHAIKVAEAAGYDVDEAHKLVSSVYNLGLTESEKIAYVQDADTAIHVRGLEYLEAAGYPVNWEEIFGS